MTPPETQRLVESVPALYRGPGGACALLKDGQVVGQHVWGYADIEKRIPMTADTILPICSISKQFVCLALAQFIREHDAAAKADKVLRELLPPELASNKDLTIERLAQMQSGIRDYWALTVLWGAQADGRFTVSGDAPTAVQKVGKLHFEPGTRWSYSNVNFYVLGRVVERITGKPLDEVLAQVIFAPAGMKTATLRPDTSDLPEPCVGYEGVEEHGFFRAVNRMEWSGDAGIIASLNDMIAYEKYLDQQWANPESTYRQNAQASTFIDGSPSFYGWGLAHIKTGEYEAVGHGGALRGFSLHRRHAPDARVSAIVMFNHEADAEAALTHLMEKTLLQPKADTDVAKPAQEWKGVYFDPEAELAIEVTHGQSGGDLMINISFHPEKVKCKSPLEARSRGTVATISGDTLTLHRPRENRTIVAQRIPPSPTPDCSAFVGKYRSEEIDSTFHISGSATMLYGSFDGYLGQGPAYLMRLLGDNIWYLSCERSLDSSAPGSWTVKFQKGSDGAVVGAVVGCWLARKVPYVKM